MSDRSKVGQRAIALNAQANHPLKGADSKDISVGRYGQRSRLQTQSLKTTAARAISATHWRASFINRTAKNVADYNSYNFSSPNAIVDLGAQGNSGKTLAHLSVNYGLKSPNGVHADNFAMQAWTRVTLQAGKTYQLSARSDDGIRFLIVKPGTTQVINTIGGDWRDRSIQNPPWTKTIASPTTANYDLYVQYYDRKGTSALDVSLQELSTAGLSGTVITPSGLNLRADPSANHQPIGALSSGDTFTIVQQVQSNSATTPSWYRIRTPDGRQGYVAADPRYVAVSAPAGTFLIGKQNNPPLPATGSGSSGARDIDQKGLNLLKSFEGLRLTAYQDAVGVWTIGYGTTRGVYPGMTITQQQAEAFLQQDLDTFEAAVGTDVTVPLTDDQFSALVSFTYNVGTGALASSTLLRLLNQKDYQGAADQFLLWNKAGGVELAGLTRRRNAERALFLGQDYTVYL
jgi:GH24 family phage-related lysozyme (muramidase)